MATSATQTVKISQTILLDIDFASIESVRIVDVDLLILLKDGQRLIVPEGAVRALMDTDFSINFKGRVFSVASLMELQTFKAQRISEVGIASKPGLPTQPSPAAPLQPERLDLNGDSAAETVSQVPPSALAMPSGAVTPPATRPRAQPPITDTRAHTDEPRITEKARVEATPEPSTEPSRQASTEASVQARENANILDQQAQVSASPIPSAPPVSATGRQEYRRCPSRYARRG